MRRWLKRVVPAACAIASISCVAIWGIGAALTDSSILTQWIWWVPQEAWLIACAFFALGAMPMRKPARFRSVAFIALSVFMAHTALVRWRTPNLLQRAESPAFTLLYWNPGVPYEIDIIPSLARHAADIMIVANQPTRTPWQDLIVQLGGVHEIPINGKFCVLTRFPMIASGITSLGLKGRLPAPDRQPEDKAARYVIDPGYAQWVELDTRELLGATTVIWIIDLPSDIALGRAEMTRDAAERIAEWAGPVQRATPGDAFAPDSPGFPPPDIVVGDFNIPRGSASLRAIKGDLADSFTQAGAGPTATWPRGFPVLHIDQCFLKAPLRATSFRVHKPDTGNHRMIEVGIKADQAR